MGKDDDAGVYRELEHVRLVHFTILVMSGVLLYIDFSMHAWSMAPKLREEINGLQASVQAMVKADPRELVKNWPTLDDENVLAAQKDLDRSSDAALAWSEGARDVIRSLVQAKDLDPTWPDVTRESLRIARQRVEQHRWQVITFDHFELDRARLQSWSKGLHLDSFDGLSVGMTQAQRDEVTIAIDVTRCMIIQDPQYAAAHTYSCSTDPKERFELPAKVVERASVRSLPPSWFSSRFPTIEKVWDRVAEMTTADAIEALDSDRAAEIYGKKATLLGLDIEGKDLGLMGPLLLAVAFLYLVAYLSQLAEQPSIALPISPWMGAMKARWARAVSAATLGIGVLAAWEMLDDFIGLTRWIVVPIVLVFFVAPIVATWIFGARLAKKAGDPSAQKSEPTAKPNVSRVIDASIEER